MSATPPCNPTFSCFFIRSWMCAFLRSSTSWMSCLRRSSASSRNACGTGHLACKCTGLIYAQAYNKPCLCPARYCQQLTSPCPHQPGLTAAAFSPHLTTRHSYCKLWLEAVPFQMQQAALLAQQSADTPRPGPPHLHAAVGLAGQVPRALLNLLPQLGHLLGLLQLQLSHHLLVGQLLQAAASRRQRVLRDGEGFAAAGATPCSQLRPGTAAWSCIARGGWKQRAA